MTAEPSPVDPVVPVRDGQFGLLAGVNGLQLSKRDAQFTTLPLDRHELLVKGRFRAAFPRRTWVHRHAAARAPAPRYTRLERDLAPIGSPDGDGMSTPLFSAVVLLHRR